VLHRQENIHYEYPFPNVGQHILAIKEKTIDSNLIAINVANLTKPRRLSEKGRDLLKSVEELRLKPYDDSDPDKVLTTYAPGKTTIGYGYLLVDKTEWETYKDGITNEQASALFDKKVKPFEQAVDLKLLYHVSQQQFDAAVVMAYNIGARKFKNSSAAKLINDPKAKTSYETLDAAWLAYNMSGGKKLKGLTNRRKCELKIYHKGVYKKW
jgi:type VI secretion system secreted protein VgrG